MQGNMNGDKSSLDSLKQKLYERDTTLSVNEGRRSDLRKQNTATARGWDDAQINSKESMAAPKRKTHKWIKWFVILSALFFVAALGIAVYMFGAGGNTVSVNNVNIGVTGPISVSGGDILTLQIDVQNGNTTTLESTDLLIEYPEGTRMADNITQELLRVRESLGDIRPGKQVTKTVDAVLFGEEGERQTIVISVEYRVADSNAIFVKEKAYEVEISSSPLSLSVVAPNQTTTNTDFQLAVEVTSNATESIEGVLLSAEYPFGFTFDEATPEPVFNDRIWDLGTLKPGESKIVRVRGALSGQDTEERVFRFAAGLGEESDPNVLVTPFANVLKGVTIARPDIGVGLVFNGDATGEYVTGGDGRIRTDVTWQNNTGERIVDGVIEVVLGGQALNQGSVTVTGGFYQSGNNTIVWDKRTVPALADIPAGGKGSVSFSFSSFDFTQDTLADPEITATARIRGMVAASEGSEVVQSESQGRVAVASDLLLSGKGLYFTGPFQKTGGLPPRVGQETTYTIQWTVTNTVSEITGATVRATLPAYMRFVGSVSPGSEEVTYNPIGGEVLWNLGTVRQGAGYTAPPREVAFQVAIIPSVSQVNETPQLIGVGTLTGIDSHTRTQVKDVSGVITTRISSDPQFQNAQGNVVQ